MIVRDEAAIVERCLASVRHLIDAWVICDTGSEDGTPELVHAALEGFPGELHRSRWRDFGTNRTELMRLARGAADYLLLIDTDHTVRVRRPLPPLTADAYLVRHAGALDYAVPRLVRGDREWRFEGSTHEYLATEGPFSQDVLDALAIDDHADGKSRAGKLERDRRLLERDLRRNADDVRAVFYLAQTVAELGDDRRATELYRRRVELGGWDEEVFYAAYQAGVVTARRDPEAAIPILLDAFERRPSRAETLYELSRVCRFLGRHEEAHAYALRGLELPYPGDLLFVHRPVYEWGLRFEHAVCAYWLGDFEAALVANDDLLALDCLPPEFEAAVQENRDYSLAKLDTGRRRVATPAGRRATGAGELLERLAPNLRLGEIRLDISSAWPQFNPTIASDGKGGARMVVRTANYRLDGHGGYRFLDGDGVIRTRNYLVGLDSDLELVDVRPLVDTSGAEVFPSRVQGFEDCRLVRRGEEWLATATVRDRNPEERCEVALLALDDDRIAKVTVLPGPVPGRHEKNWMPFVVDRRLELLYSCGPTVVFACEVASGELELRARHPAPPEAAAFRGSSQGASTTDGFLFVVHEAVAAGGGRSYSHRFVLLDETYRLSAYSPRFRFVHPGVEFCAGLAQHGQDLVLTFGVGDRAAGIAVVPSAEVLGLLDEVRPV